MDSIFPPGIEHDLKGRRSFLTNIFGPTGDDGGFQRFTAEYDITDSIELTGGIVFYQSGDLRRTMGIGDNDRVYFEVQYNF